MYRDRRRNTGRVPRVDPSLLYVLHDPPDVHLLPVRDRVHVDLHVVLHELVDEDRVLGIGADAGPQIQVQILIVVNDLHPPPAENVRGPHDHRVAEPTGDLPRFLSVFGSAEAGMRNAELGQQTPEAGAVLGQVYGVRGGAEDLRTVLLQLAGELQGALAAELEDDAHRLFAADDLEDTLGGQGLEVQPRGGIVVGRDGLRVGVDHHRIEAGFFEGVARVDAGVVELDALTDAVRTAPEHDHGGAIPAHAPDHLRRGTGGCSEGPVGEPDPLQLHQLLRAQGLGNRPFGGYDPGYRG